MSRGQIEALQTAVIRTTSAWAAFDRREQELRDHYLAGSPGPADREAYENAHRQAVAMRDAQLTTLERDAGRTSVQAEADHRGKLRADSPPRADEIGGAWRDRVEPQLRSGLTPEQIAETPGFSRADLHALRANFPAWAAAAAGPEGAASPMVRGRLAEAGQAFDALEGRLIGDPTVREAVIDERDRQRADRALNTVFSYSKSRQSSPGVAPLDDLTLGFTLAADLGQPAHVLGAKPWDSILDQVDPGWRAEAARGALDPRYRAGLDANVAERPNAESFGGADPSLGGG